MDALQWSALLIPHPNPRLFTGKKKLYRLAAPSSFDSRSSFMSSLSDGKHKRGKLRKPRTSSPPPKIQPFSFECESPITPNIFDFFSLHDTSDDKDDVQVFTPTSLYTLDGNLMSQPQGAFLFLYIFTYLIIISLNQTPIHLRAGLLTSLPQPERKSPREFHSQLRMPTPLLLPIQCLVFAQTPLDISLAS